MKGFGAICDKIPGICLMRKAETKPPQVRLAYHQVAQRILLEIRLAQAEQIDDLVVRLRQNVVSSYSDVAC